MVILDPASWKPIQIFKMHERDGLPRTSTPHAGFEDMRIFRTDKGGLQGIAASLHLKRVEREVEGMPQHQPSEQVLLSFDANYDIVGAHPLRAVSGAQKNWSPFDSCAEPRFLYSIEKGSLFDDQGKLHGDDARVTPSTRSAAPSPPIAARSEPPLELPDPPRREDKAARKRRRTPVRGGDVRSVRGGRIKLDTMTSRPSSRPSSRSSRPSAPRSSEDSVRVMGSGQILLPKYEGLRGGSQLVRVAEDAWLGVGHSMRFVSGKKFYWHVFFLTNSRGRMTSASEPCKLASEGIEFAAGMAIDGDRVVVSFGVDDMYSRLGETCLSAVLEMLRPIER